MRNLAIFDIDGTLITHLPEGNDKCFIRTMKAEWGVDWLEDSTEFWGTFTHATDSFIASELHRRQFGRGPGPDEVARVKAALLADMEREFGPGGARYVATPGAPAVFPAIRGLGGWEVAVATGNWGATGRFKAENAGVSLEGVPFASADDSFVRVDIVREAIARAGAGFDRVVFVGDTLWDADTSAKLGLHFIGVGRGEGARKLAAAGARETVPDFADTHGFLRVLGGI